MLMIQNNLDPAVAQHPHELITYGGNGAVFQNWAQYRLTMKYLSEMADDQTLVMYSGHPLGLFPSHADAPRVVVTNGMVIPNYSQPDDCERMNALGVSQYGQMTAGSYMYIGPQGIVHGTTITVLNACRMIKSSPGTAGKLFVTAGLGGMSGAQPKAGNIVIGDGPVVEIKPDTASGKSDGDAQKKRYKDAFEKKAVTVLSEGVREFEAIEGDDFRFVGTIRLHNSCLKCHVPFRKSLETRFAGLSVRIPIQPEKPVTEAP